MKVVANAESAVAIAVQRDAAVYTPGVMVATCTCLPSFRSILSF